MKTPIQIIIGFALCAATAISAESVRITEENIPFVYELKAEIPTSREILAGILSEDYRKAEDEFTAREMFQKIEPVIVKRLATAKETKLWRVEITGVLAPYDFNSKSFPSQLTAKSFVQFSSGRQNYAVQFSNTEAFRDIPVEMDAAKNLSAKLRKSRVSILHVEGTIKESLEKTINYNRLKVLIFEISKMTIKLEDGTYVGEYTPSGGTGQNPAAAPLNPVKPTTKIEPAGE